MILTDGRWDRSERHVYFLAGHATPTWTGDPAPHVLIAVNEMLGTDGKVRDRQAGRVDHLLSVGARVLIDSGVFWLTNRHRVAHGISIDDALALDPDDLDGFDWLWQGYLEVQRRWGRDVWGSIEVDQGGAANKRRLRQRLHDLGVNPMPVYHPLSDGWDYFDELAESYDRMCAGNVAQGSAPRRKRLLHTIAERHRRYPDLWVHWLGLTPNEWVHAFPVDSCDSSAWLASARWHPPVDAAMCSTVGELPRGFQYRLGSSPDDPDGRERGVYLSATLTAYLQRGWDHFTAHRDTVLGLPAYPPLTPQENLP